MHAGVSRGTIYISKFDGVDLDFKTVKREELSRHSHINLPRIVILIPS